MSALAQALLAAYGSSSGFTLSGTNILGTGTRTATGQGPSNWFTFNAANATDGNFTNSAGISTSAAESENNLRGFSFTFSRNVRLGRFSVWRYNYPFDWVIQYFNGSTWVTVATLANGTAASPAVLDFNTDGAITASQWRLYVANWAFPSDNLYVYEVQGFELV